VSEKDDTSICNNLPHTHDTSKSNENITSESHKSIVLEKWLASVGDMTVTKSILLAQLSVTK